MPGQLFFLSAHRVDSLPSRSQHILAAFDFDSWKLSSGSSPRSSTQKKARVADSHDELNNSKRICWEQARQSYTHCRGSCWANEWCTRLEDGGVERENHYCTLFLKKKKKIPMQCRVQIHWHHKVNAESVQACDKVRLKLAVGPLAPALVRHWST